MRLIKLPPPSVAYGLALTLAPLPACADGLAGLAGLRQFGTLAVAAFCLLWIVIWAVVRAARKPRSGKTYWLKSGAIPLSLRLLALAQYVLAFGYAFLAVTDLLMAGDFRRESPMAGLLAAAIAVLCVVSAGGYIARSTARGYRTGIGLGCVCIINIGVSMQLRVSPGEFDFVSLLLAVALLTVLSRNRNWFPAPPATNR
jgi:hypothetical protein